VLVPLDIANAEALHGLVRGRFVTHEKAPVVTGAAETDDRR
jgi:hypothetical protein